MREDLSLGAVRCCIIQWTLCILSSTLLMTAGSAGNALAQHENTPEPDPPRIEAGAQAAPLTQQWHAPLGAGSPVEWTYHKTGDNAHPDANEQQLMWLMNRARANPAQEGAWLANTSDSQVESAISYWGVDLPLMQSEFAAIPAKPPAAFDVRLYNAAKAHSDDLIARDAQDHVGQFSRITAAGFVYATCRGNVFSYSKYALYGHAAFNIDWGSDGGDGSGMQPSRGHRKAIMAIDGDYVNVGLAAVSESDPGTFVGPQVITGNYCLANSSAADHYNRFIVGTVWTDTNSNSQYDPGEGIAGVTAMPDQGGFYAVTADSGGYAIPVTAAGTYTVSFSGSAITGTVDRSIAVGGDSVLLDLEYSAASGLPEVNTAEATAVTATSATLNGTVNANGTACIYFFEYGPTTAYESSTASYTTSANSTVAVTVTGLTTGTTYHYRLVADNGTVTIYGADRTFTAAAGSTSSQSSGGGGGGGGCFVTGSAGNHGPWTGALLLTAAAALAALARLSQRPPAKRVGLFRLQAGRNRSTWVLRALKVVTGCRAPGLETTN